MIEDYYKLLGIHPGSSMKMVQEALNYKLQILKSEAHHNSESAIAEIRILNKIYDTLMNPDNRLIYDQLLLNSVAAKTNFISSSKTPEINYFKVDKKTVQLNDNITISWKTTNADQVILLPFGPVDYEGEKIIEIESKEDIISEIKLLAENTVNGLKCSKVILLNDNEYNDRYLDYKKRKETKEKLYKQIKSSKEKSEIDSGINKYLSIKSILISVLFILILTYFVKCN